MPRRTVTSARIAAAAALSVVLGLALAACGSEPPAETSTPSIATSSVEPSIEPTAEASASDGPQSLSALLDELVVAPEHRDGYDRELFPHWIDADLDGCNTRREVLIAQAVVPPTVTGTCNLTGGEWISPYDGVTLRNADDVQIDHVVALAEAWYSGAYAWTTERRERFANDLDVPWELNAVSPDINETKAAYDPAEWLPPLRSYLCPYLEDWIGTKVRWGLTIDPREKRALAKLVPRCPDSALTVPVVTP